jgi:hypothetical protein
VKTSSLLRLLPLGLLPLAAACGGDARAAGGPVVRDSAGVQIVENTAPAWRDGEGWTVAAEPLLDIGVADGAPEYQFGEVAGAVRLADGRIVVADAQAKHLRFFDGAGVHVRTVGRSGGGPGEFQGLMRLLRLPGDTLATWDYRLSRLSLFAPDGTFLRSRTLPPPTGAPAMLQVEGAFADGSLVVAPVSLIFSKGTSVTRDTVTLLHYAADGEGVDSIGRFPGALTLSVAWEENDGGATRGPVPFGPNTYRAVRGDLLRIADSERFEVASYSADGVLRQRVRRAYTPEPLTPAEIERHEEAQRSGVGTHNRQVVERSLAATPYPETKSAFAGMVVDRQGAVWLREHPAGDGAPSRWTVLDADGAWLGTVETPAGLAVMEVGADYVLGVWRDELDVEHVRLYRLDKR